MKLRADHDRLRERLEALNAGSAGRVRQVDTYYDHPTRSFADTDEALRIRRETAESADESEDDEAGDRTRVTYKGPLLEAESKTRAELETGVADGETLASILGKLGFEAAATVEKDRERFRYDGYTVTLDTVSGLGEFVEVETEAETIEPAREGAVDVLEQLGLDPDAQIRRSYLGLLLDDAE